MKILNRDCVDFLVVDDDPLVTRFLSDYLKERGHTCATLTKAFQTAAWLELHDCEVVVVDLNMASRLIKTHIRISMRVVNLPSSTMA